MIVDIETLDIDITRLDKEWLEHPKMAHKAIDSFRILNDKLRKGKARLTKVEAEASLRIRRNPEKYGLDKTTDSVIKAAVQVDKKFVETQARFLDLQNRTEKARVTVDFMDIRRKALEYLVRLHGQDYFASPRVTQYDEDGIKERIVRDRIRKTGKKRKKKTT